MQCLLGEVSYFPWFFVVSFKDVEASHSEKTGRDDDDDEDMDEDVPTKVVKPEAPDSMFIFKSKNP